MSQTGTVAETPPLDSPSEVAPAPGHVVWREIRQLTGLRGLAALDVMMGHYNQEQVPFLHWLEFQNAAVDIFFCLSGFTLCLVYGAGLGPRLDLRNYAAARIARIYPLYVAVLLVALWYSVRWDLNSYHTYKLSGLVRDGVRQLLLVNAWPLVGNGTFWVDPLWSISAEAFCYAAVFLPAYALSRHMRHWSPRLLAALMLLLPAFAYGFFVRYFDSRVNGHGYPPPSSQLAYWVAVVRAVAMFGSGWLAYLLWLQRGVLARGAGLMTDAACVLFLAALAGQAWTVVNVQMVVLLAPVIVLGLMDDRSVAARVFAWRPVHFLGVISYSLYLLHWPVVLILLHRWPELRHTQVTRILVPMLVTTAASVLSFYAFELPARRVLRRVLGRRLPAAALAT